MTPGEEAWSLDRVSPEHFQNQGLYLDTAPIVTGGVLLVILFALSFNRILGLDRFLARKWKEERDERKRREVMDARQQLTKSWSEADGGQDSADGTGGDKKL